MHDFVGAFNNNVDARVAPNSLNAIFGYVAFAAHDLHGVIHNAKTHFAAEHFAHCGFQHDVLIMSIKETRGHVQNGVHGIKARTHARDFFLNEIKLRDGSVELIAIISPFTRLFKGVCGAAQHARTERATTII